MKKSFAIVGILSLFLMACSQNMATKSPAVSLPNVSQLSQLAPSNSYIAVEPLAENKLKMTITAKDKNLFITNCNYTIMYSIFEAKTHKPVLNNGYYTCWSDDIIVPKGMSLTDIKTSDELASGLSLDKTYYLQVAGIFYNNRNEKQPLIPNSLSTSNEFKLLP